jgi:hypothetical protein
MLSILIFSSLQYNLGSCVAANCLVALSFHLPIHHLPIEKQSECKIRLGITFIPIGIEITVG